MPLSRGSGLAALQLPEHAGFSAVGRIEVDELPELLRSGAVIIDVRSSEERADGHIKNSRHIPFSDWEELEDSSEANAAARLLSSAADGGASHLVFHCMYSKERAPRAADFAASALEGAWQNSGLNKIVC
eukprot:TRINITY_DN60192_c0_g1_i1.p1 TRINITY_DN60192_c0_g1~~TRINITY_DN60192_c0_g1_i1.p1  ORF type:complete len:130 (-),score=25.70 TRINITY_DN60192_c0_g1_i1:321-710(-)